MNGSIEFGNERIENAKIKFTQSGINEDDSLVMQIGFELAENKLICTKKFSFDENLMKSILNVLEIRNWEELPKKYARIAILNGNITRVGNILNNKWVIIK